MQNLHTKIRRRYFITYPQKWNVERGWPGMRYAGFSLPFFFGIWLYHNLPSYSTFTFGRLSQNIKSPIGLELDSNRGIHIVLVLARVVHSTATATCVRLLCAYQFGLNHRQPLISIRFCICWGSYLIALHKQQFTKSISISRKMRIQKCQIHNYYLLSLFLALFPINAAHYFEIGFKWAMVRPQRAAFLTLRETRNTRVSYRKTAGRLVFGRFYFYYTILFSKN